MLQTYILKEATVKDSYNGGERFTNLTSKHN